eukprot:CAMPEP_0179187122 /NCGR_PEP_ID=MMETSP0796-20121207/92840_1 /TAXON_ID=73915 /ORGANISM="Pyrodinium bahamense, Strain pbaha01" /LENGTH=32 /DNA_ID= /DNA_START= /DNA_END= /DNA_ORIENTATION=
MAGAARAMYCSGTKRNFLKGQLVQYLTSCLAE